MNKNNNNNNELLQQQQNISQQIIQQLNFQTQLPQNNREDVQNDVFEDQTSNKNKKISKQLQKQYALEAQREGNILSIANKYSIPESTLRRWKNMFSSNSPSNQSAQKTPQQKRPKYLKLELELIEWITSQRQLKLSVNIKSIQKQALAIYKQRKYGENEEMQFQASLGWFYRFKKRWKLSRRAVTHVQSKLKEDYLLQIKKWQDELKNFRIERGVILKKKIIFINYDETSIFFDLQSGTTYDFQGKKEITFKTVQRGKQRMTLGLTILSNGIKLPILAILKSRLTREQQSIDPTKLILKKNQKGWISEQILVEYLKKLIFNIKNYSDVEFCYILDQCYVHKKQEIVDLFKQNNLKLSFIPAGCTSLVQPLDVSINKPFKDRMRQHFQVWFGEKGVQNENQSKNGYIKPPSIDLMQEWIISSFEQIDYNIIVNAFKKCGITNSLEGDEDYLINSDINNNQVLEQIFDKFTKDTIEDDADYHSLIQKEEFGVDKLFTYNIDEKTYETVIEGIEKQGENSIENIIEDILQETESQSLSQNSQTFSDIDENIESLEIKIQKKRFIDENQSIYVSNNQNNNSNTMEEEYQFSKLDINNKIFTYESGIFKQPLNQVQIKSVQQQLITNFFQKQ